MVVLIIFVGISIFRFTMTEELDCVTMVWVNSFDPSMLQFGMANASMKGVGIGYVSVLLRLSNYLNGLGLGLFCLYLSTELRYCMYSSSVSSNRRRLGLFS
jgi:hypothetical protein